MSVETSPAAPSQALCARRGRMPSFSETGVFRETLRRAQGDAASRTRIRRAPPQTGREAYFSSRSSATPLMQ